eukprot:TRINITY_DN4987_c0_g1_i1.p1 TRINITY_DN4987_c0_g1~~TRINITY_DN4987_c0_g1_i1.p1  ORF type:complete len:677 (-),score=75.92 TRINITY_DN4987_c0_g1_i1:77-2107(-)
MKPDNATIIAALAPAPSVSRMGRMADMSMHTKSLARSGIQAFTTVTKKRPRLGIIVAEVVDATVLDPFGTSKPAEDGGRGSELCSSPREHPQLAQKAIALRNAEKQLQFRKSVGTGSQKEGVAPPDASVLSQSQSNDQNDRLEKHRRMFLPEEPDETNSRTSGGDMGSSFFRTVPRDHFAPGNLETPAVGHYRPRFTVVEKRNPAAFLMGKASSSTGQRELRVPSAPSSQDPTGNSGSNPSGAAQGSPHASEPPRPPTLHERSHSGVGGLDGRDTSHFDEHSLSRGASLFGRTQTTTHAQPQQANVPVDPAPPATPKKKPPVRGSAVFLSKVKNRPEVRPVLDRDHWPINENALSTNRFASPNAVDFSRQLDRGQTRSRGHFDTGKAPDVVYQVEGAMAPKVKGDVLFDKQLPRNIDQAMVLKYPADHVHYDTNTALSRKPGPTPDFSKYTPRSLSPYGSGSGPAPLSSETSGTELSDKFSGRRSPQVRFDRQTPRSELPTKISTGLEYEPNHEVVLPRVRAVDLHNGKGHADFFARPPTANIDLDPKDNVVRPRVRAPPDFAKALSRDVSPTSKQSPKASVDRFYDTDTELVRPRVTGNPMLRSHMSREQRNHALRPQNMSPDSFYDYNVDKILPRTVTGGVINFAKSSPRKSFLNQQQKGGPGALTASNLNPTA